MSTPDTATQNAHPGDPGPAPARVDSIVSTLRNLASISQLLRVLGAAVIVVSMSLFLLQGWHDGNDTMRYLKLLAQTGLLGIGGLALSHGLKEAKGARVFFGLALVSVPANFTILGALVYSLFQIDGGLTTYPAFATWEMADLGSIGLTMAGALLVLVPVARFCFAIMARQSARALTMHFAALNLMLLIPARLPVIASTVALAGMFYAAWAIARMRRRDAALHTPEGRFALTTLFIPLGIVLARSLLFYDVDSLSIAVLATTAFFALRHIAVYPNRNRFLVATLNVLCLPIAAVAALGIVDAIVTTAPFELLGPTAAVVFTALGLDVHLRTPQRALKRITSVLIGLFVTLGCILPLAVQVSVPGIVAALAAGAALMLLGVWVLGRSAIAFGAITVLGAGWLGLENVTELLRNASWVTWALLGAFAIALGSVLERHGLAIKRSVEQWGRQIKPRTEAVLDA